jgi:RHS repeat-associated protein
LHRQNRGPAASSCSPALSSFTLFDGLNRPVSVAAAGGAVSTTQSFGYDRVNRLTAASEGGTWTRNYAYDEWGNGWVSLNSTLSLDPTTPTAATNFDANNRLNVDSAAYNAAGNQTAIAGFTNTYDAENRLLTSTLNGLTTTYTYDGDGRRVQKATGGATTTYVYDAAGQLAAEYATAPPAPPCTTCYLTEDHLGSTRMMTDGTTGKPLDFHDYLPFGEEIQAGVGGRSSTYYPPGPLAINDTVAQKFTGKQRDQETGLDYFGARYYGSPQGRWTTPDWSERPQVVPYARLEDPQTLNLFTYVRNNPLATGDADGHTDYYTTAGKPLGNDGVNNGVVVVAKTPNVQRMDDGTIIAPSVQEQYRISPAVSNAMHESVDRSNSPSGTSVGPDTKGGFHEEGFTVDSNGIHVAAPGPAFRPGDKEAGVTQKVSADTKIIEHVHPAGNTDSNTFGGTNFNQDPSKPDMTNAASRPDTVHIVVGAGDNQVRFYDANGTQAKVPLDKFPRQKDN